MQRRTICVAGHVDHGKTALVAALTGHDTDRLPEEKQRGLSIEPGFAPLELPGAPPVSLVDLPGHERFVRHMVAGASGVDAYLLCVACDDGVMPQTREHLMVLQALGIARGVAALTKTDRADSAAAERGVRALLGREISVVPVCAHQGRGLDQLRQALAEVAAASPRRMERGAGRLFVDRAFSVPGAGTVVTGTLWGAPIDEGMEVQVHPSGARARVRGLEVHGSRVGSVSAGRVAVNLARASLSEVGRGSCIGPAGELLGAVDRIDARITWLPATPAELRSGRRLQLLLGTVQVAARCLLPRGSSIACGATGDLHLRLERPIPALAGDRFVLRDATPTTVGGGMVREVSAPPQEARPQSPAPSKRSPAAQRLYDRCQADLAERGIAGITAVAAAEVLGVAEKHAIAALRDLVEDGAAVRINRRRVVDSAFLEAAAGAAIAALGTRGLTLRELADLWGVNREAALAVAEYMDRQGLTHRKNDRRYREDSGSQVTAGPPGDA